MEAERQGARIGRQVCMGGKMVIIGGLRWAIFALHN